jgi:D-alanyl-lipoteichoic acid acyltransferase DltB (MBOAT superfamily)
MRVIHVDRYQVESALAVGLVVLVLFYFKVLAPYASTAFGQTSSFALPLGLSYFTIRLIDVIFAARAGTLKEVGTIEFFGFMLHPTGLSHNRIFSAIGNHGI